MGGIVLIWAAREELQYEDFDDSTKKLDELSAPFSDDMAYHAFLEMQRLSVGLTSSSTSGKKAMRKPPRTVKINR